MSKPASNQARLHQAKAIARHRKQQEQRAIEQMVTDTPNRAQRRDKRRDKIVRSLADRTNEKGLVV